MHRLCVACRIDPNTRVCAYRIVSSTMLIQRENCFQHQSINIDEFFMSRFVFSSFCLIFRESLKKNTRTEASKSQKLVYVYVCGWCNVKHDMLAIHRVKSMGMYADAILICMCLQRKDWTLVWFWCLCCRSVHVESTSFSIYIIWCALFVYPINQRKCTFRMVADSHEFILIDKAESSHSIGTMASSYTHEIPSIFELNRCKIELIDYIGFEFSRIKLHQTNNAHVNIVVSFNCFRFYQSPSLLFLLNNYHEFIIWICNW